MLWHFPLGQCAKNLIISRSDSPGLEKFCYRRLVNSVINLPNGQVKFYYRRTIQCNQPAHHNVFGASWNDVWASINVSFSLLEWQALTMIFFAPCFKWSFLYFFYYFSYLTFSLYNMLLILSGENRCWSLLWLKGWISVFVKHKCKVCSDCLKLLLCFQAVLSWLQRNVTCRMIDQF